MVRASGLQQSMLLLGSLLAGCGLPLTTTPVREPAVPLAPMLGEPSLVRVHTAEIELMPLASPLSSAEKTAPDAGYRFVAVGFRIGQQQTLAIDDYELETGEEEWRLPFAVAVENAAGSPVCYDAEEFAETVALTQAAEETQAMQGQGDDEGPLLVSWATPGSVLLLLYEVPAGAKTVTLHHGVRSFQLAPETGKIEGKAASGK